MSDNTGNDIWLNYIKSVKPLKKLIKFEPEAQTNISTPPGPPLPKKYSPKHTAYSKFVYDHQQICKVDLHGYKLIDAYEFITNYLEQAYLSNTRTILIITGKGSPAKPSIIRENLARFLLTTEVAKYIISVKQAPHKLGGSGAFIVKLKRQNTYI